MMHFLDEIDAALRAKLAAYLRARQAEHGGWPLYHGGELRHQLQRQGLLRAQARGRRARGAAHAAGARRRSSSTAGAARANVFTRITLALFGQVPWRAVPYIPVEIMLLPRWFPFHLDKVSYWSRTVMVPLFDPVHAAGRAPAIRARSTSGAVHRRRRSRSSTTFRRRRGLAHCTLFLLLDRMRAAASIR